MKTVTQQIIFPNYQHLPSKKKYTSNSLQHSQYTKTFSEFISFFLFRRETFRDVTRPVMRRHRRSAIARLKAESCN